MAVSFIGGRNRSTQRKPPVTSHLQTLSHYVVLSTPCPSRVRTHTDCRASCKSNYHTITTTKTPEMLKPYTCNNSRQLCNAVLTSTNIVSFDKVDIQYQYSAHWLIAISIFDRLLFHILMVFFYYYLWCNCYVVHLYKSIFFVTSKLIEINLQHILCLFPLTEQVKWPHYRNKIKNKGGSIDTSNTQNRISCVRLACSPRVQ